MVERASRRSVVKPELVVGDDVDRAAGPVAGQAAQVQGLGHDALAGERRVPVDDDRQRLLPVLARGASLVAVFLGRAGHPLDHRVDVLQVARVRRQVDEHRLVGRLVGKLEAADAQVVLHVPDPGRARALGDGRGLALVRLLELVEDLGVRLVQDVRQHVQAPAVGHAEGDLGGADVGGGTDQAVQHGHDHVVALDGETLLAEERPVQVLLERVDPGEPEQEPLGALTFELLGQTLGLNGLAQPEALLGVVDVPEVVAGRVAVDAPELFGGLQGRRGALGDRTADDEGRQRLEVPIGDPVEARVEGGVAGRLAAQRVEPRGPVAEVPDVPDVLGGPHGLLDVHFGRDGPRDGGRPVRLQARRAPPFEKAPGPLVHGVRVLPELLVKFQDVA